AGGVSKPLGQRLQGYPRCRRDGRGVGSALSRSALVSGRQGAGGARWQWPRVRLAVSGRIGQRTKLNFGRWVDAGQRRGGRYPGPALGGRRRQWRGGRSREKELRKGGVISPALSGSLVTLVCRTPGYLLAVFFRNRLYQS